MRVVIVQFLLSLPLKLPPLRWDSMIRVDPSILGSFPFPVTHSLLSWGLMAEDLPSPDPTPLLALLPLIRCREMQTYSLHLIGVFGPHLPSFYSDLPNFSHLFFSSVIPFSGLIIKQ